MVAVEPSVMKVFTLENFYFITGLEWMPMGYIQDCTVGTVIILANIHIVKIITMTQPMPVREWTQMSRPKSPPFIIITRAVYKLDLSPNEKLVLANIGNVILSGGTYYFDNEFISEYTNTTERQVRTILNSLITKGFIERQLIYREGTKEVLKRVVKLTSIGGEVCDSTPGSKLPHPPEVNFLGNRKSSLVNTQVNNKKELSQRFKEFAEEVRAFTEYSQYHEAFINWWGEDNGTDMKWELERRKKGTFAIKNRLNTFKLRDTTQGQDAWEDGLREKYAT